MKNIHLIPTEPNDETSGGIWIEKTRDWCNIYITNLEEIKEGDSIFETDTNTINVIGKDYVENEFDFKIILTDNKELIKDGVQAIDDEFLEWFVKNPSCEFVEVDRDEREVGNHLGGVVTEYGDYKIIIPKEESIQETLEEVAENYKINIIKSGRSHRVEYTQQIKLDFIEGAKWQQERSYSEEEMIAFGEFIFKHSLLTHTRGVKSLFEQFKNK